VSRAITATADEMAFPFHMTGFLMWARRGSEGLEIPIHGNEKLSYTVMVVVAAALTRLPIRVRVKGKTTLAEKGLGVPEASFWDSDRVKTG
jgi:hypothetical protein